MTEQDPRSVAELRQLLAESSGAALTRLCAQLEDDARPGVVSALQAAQSRERARLTERNRLSRLYAFESDLHGRGFVAVAGVDEVGRGALAGPLSAGACILPPNPRIEGLDDSKRLSPAKREMLAAIIREVAVCWSVAHVPADQIDALGVTAALRRAMGRAIAGLQLEPDHVVLDGLPLGVCPNESAVVKGDSTVAAISAASIVAKVARDALMVEFAESHPEYQLDINKGYGTPEHLAAIETHGLSPIHRRSFTPGGGTSRLF